LLRLTYFSAAALSLFAASMVAVSMLIPERAPHSARFWIITTGVGVFFASLGLVLLGIGRHLPAIGVLARSMTSEAGALLRSRYQQLSAHMLLGGLLLPPVLLFVAYAFCPHLARMSKMILLFRLIHACAAFLSIAVAVLIAASLFIADRTPRSMEFLGIGLVVGAVFVGLGLLLLGVRRHVTAIATLQTSHDATASRLAIHVSRLLVYLIAGGALLCAVLGLLTYAILERIGQGFAVFG
jgi:hypothetical protein